jgi:hypothetical protein
VQVDQGGLHDAEPGAADAAQQQRGAGRPDPRPLEPAQFIPTAHHRCRCWTRVKQIDGELRIVWQTNQDEMVCKQPIVTPWGTVAGCRELHGTILSTGVKV